MAKKSKNKKNNIVVTLQSWLSRSKKLVEVFLAVISSKLTRWLLIILLFATSIWLLYMNMWLPLQQIKGLPPGVNQRNPQIQEDMLRELHVDRADRVQHENSSYNNTIDIFQAPTEQGS